MILIVDDEAPVVRVIRLALERIGHEVRSATSGAEADQIAATLGLVDVLIANHRVAPERGRDIAERLLLTHPEMKVIHVSGYPKQTLEDECSLTPGAEFLGKPFTVDQIQTAVEHLLAAGT